MNNHHSDRYLKSWPILSSRIERVLCWTIKSDDFLHDRRQIFVGRFYWQTKSANFIDRLTSPLHRNCRDRSSTALRSSCLYVVTDFTSDSHRTMLADCLGYVFCYARKRLCLCVTVYAQLINARSSLQQQTWHSTVVRCTQ